MPADPRDHARGAPPPLLGAAPPLAARLPPDLVTLASAPSGTRQAGSLAHTAAPPPSQLAPACRVKVRLEY